MKLNNRGMSLMELLVSIVLVGIVLTFLFQLLVDLKNETDNNNYAYNNQINRTESIYTIEQDLNKYALLGVEDKSTGRNIIINFYFKKGKDTKTAVLKTATNISTNEFGDEVKKYYLRYTSVDDIKYSWEMKGAEIDPCGSVEYYLDSVSNNYYFKMNIYLYNIVYHERNKKNKNNAVDDIEITYAGEKDDLITTNGSYLTGSTKGDKKIVTCAINRKYQ